MFSGLAFTSLWLERHREEQTGLEQSSGWGEGAFGIYAQALGTMENMPLIIVQIL